MNIDWERKYLKYKSKYHELLAQAVQAGGAAKKALAKKAPAKKITAKKTKKKPSVKKAPEKKAVVKKTATKPEDDDRPSIRITCVKVHQKREDLHFEGSMCKTPPIRVRVTDEETKWAKVVKILLRYVSRRLRMNEVKKVVIKQGKKSKTLDGDKLDGVVDVVAMENIDEMEIFME